MRDKRKSRSILCKLTVFFLVLLAVGIGSYAFIYEGRKDMAKIGELTVEMKWHNYGEKRLPLNVYTELGKGSESLFQLFWFPSDGSAQPKGCLRMTQIPWTRKGRTGEVSYVGLRPGLYREYKTPYSRYKYKWGDMEWGVDYLDVHVPVEDLHKELLIIGIKFPDFKEEGVERMDGLLHELAVSLDSGILSASEIGSWLEQREVGKFEVINTVLTPRAPKDNVSIGTERSSLLRAVLRSKWIWLKGLCGLD